MDEQKTSVYYANSFEPSKKEFIIEYVLLKTTEGSSLIGGTAIVDEANEVWKRIEKVCENE